MALYFKPPRGTIPLHMLQKCVEERLKFFKKFLGVPTSMHSVEYLFEDSAFDRAGHFTLRLAAVRDSSFRHTFIKCEVLLFQLRLDSYTDKNALRGFLTTSLRHVCECLCEIENYNKITQLLKTFEGIFTKLLSKSFRSHIFEDAHTEDICKNFSLKVPFQHCLSLLTTYSYELINGYVNIPCHKWKDLLSSMYDTYLKVAIQEMQYNSGVHRALADERIQFVLSLISSNGFSQVSTYMSLKNTRLETRYFPLCMQNLQNNLHKKHRLAHEERFNLSLFLKDIGMSLRNAISYWQFQYSQHAACTNCMHNWQQDGKRYIYSIRHLYGLEGSRRLYSSRSCNYFQQMVLTPMQEGGCPFKHFDSSQLKQLMIHAFKLCDLELDNCDHIFIERSKDPSNACKLFSKTLSDALNKPVLKGDINFNSPVQYYAKMKSL